jgi:hypothetical protein
MRNALDVLRVLVKRNFLHRGMHLSATCPVVRQHPSRDPVCDCGRTQLWQDIRRLIDEPESSELWQDISRLIDEPESSGH